MKSVRVTGLVLALAASTALAQAPLRAVRFAQPGPLVDANASVWKGAREVTVPMLPQVVTTPTNPTAAVNQLKVRAAHNGQWLSLRLEWADKTRNDRVLTDQFGDQVAIEFPVDMKGDAIPSPMMGHKGGRVNILQWRAPFQRDIDEGEPTSHGAESRDEEVVSNIAVGVVKRIKAAW